MLPRNSCFDSEILFRRVVEKIFQSYDFKTSVEFEQSGIYYDFIADNDKLGLAVEVKFSISGTVNLQYLNKTITRLTAHAKDAGRIPVLVIGGILQASERLEFDKGVIICDIGNLLYLVSKHDELHSELVTLLDFSVEKAISTGIDEKLQIDKLVVQISESNKLKEELVHWNKQGRDHYREYEDLCVRTLKSLFSEELTLWNEQQNSNNSLFHFDLICKIKHNVSAEFWSVSESYFSTKYVVFEFKNYNEQITQKEVFTTEKYLYAKALRRIAIIISTKGMSENADKARRGVLRENGKVIISLTNDDLVKMLEMKEQSSEPSDFLSKKLDELLVNLEK
ncbi:MAG: hypothetical protein R3Y63_10195 [Eubacteriales bacterium]